MAGKREFLGRRKDSQSCGAAIFSALEKRRLGQVRFAGERLHRLVGKSITTRKDREWVALKGRGRKDINDDVAERAHACTISVSNL